MKIEEFAQTTHCVAEDQTLKVMLLGLMPIHTTAKNMTVISMGANNSGLIQIVDAHGDFWYVGVHEILAIKVEITAPKS